MRRVILLTTLTIILATGYAMADSIDGRFGLTGKAGAFVPLKDDFVSGTSETDPDFAFGGGLIYGFGKKCALEFDVTHVPTAKVETSGVRVGKVSLTDLSLGLQYRFVPDNRLVPYIGAGVDLINGDLTNLGGVEFDFDWTVGGHVNAGVDYFITRGIALTADARGIYAAKGDIKSTSLEYDPAIFIGTVGIRLFLPESTFE